MRVRPIPRRRLTVPERRGFDALRRELRESGIPTLLDFANQTARPWKTTWGGFTRIAGEPFAEWAADELQGTLRAWLHDLAQGRLAFSLLPVTVHYTFDRHGLSIDGPQRDLSEYLDWVLCEAIRSGDATKIRACAYPPCGRYFHGKGRHCRKGCADRHARAKRDPARLRAMLRARQAAWRRHTFDPA